MKIKLFGLYFFHKQMNLWALVELKSKFKIYLGKSKKNAWQEKGMYNIKVGRMEKLS